MNRIYLLLLVATAFSTALFSCQKDPEIITETITIHDTVYVTQQVTDTLIQHIIDTMTVTELVEDTATTFILLRHAETAGAGSDPGLSAAGLERAEELARVLQGVALDGIYSSNYNRTKQTAQPLATSKGLTTTTYPATVLDPLAEGILENNHGKAVVVLGHSNTVPLLLNILTGTDDFSNLPETQYDNLFIVSVFEKGRSKVVHLKYGKPTP
jgi:broad specificity phosphatase PhoE